jgi:hypothetical protein
MIEAKRICSTSQEKWCSAQKMLAPSSEGVSYVPAARFGALLLGRFLPKLGGAFGRRHFF